MYVLQIKYYDIELLEVNLIANFNRLTFSFSLKKTLNLVYFIFYSKLAKILLIVTTVQICITNVLFIKQAMLEYGNNYI